MICRLCLSDLNEEIAIPLFDSDGINIEVEFTKTIEKHLNLKLTSQDSAIICVDCWKHLEDFNNFSKNVEQKQLEFSQQKKQEFCKIKVENSVVMEDVDNIFYNNIDSDNKDENEEEFIKENCPSKKRNSFIDNIINNKRQKIQDCEFLPNNCEAFEIPNELDNNNREEILDNANLNDNKAMESKNINLIIPNIEIPEVVEEEKNSNKGILIIAESIQTLLKSENNIINLDDDDSKYNDSNQSGKDDNEISSTDDDIPLLISNNKVARKTSTDNIEDLNTPLETEKVVYKLEKKSQSNLTKIDLIRNVMEMNLTCEHCGERFTKYEQLSFHFEEKHPGLIAFVKCCDKVFLKNDLQYHVNNYHAMNTYKLCEYCGKKCTKLSDYLKHVHNHVEENKSNLNCDICTLTFTTPELLQSHVDSLHGKSAHHHGNEISLPRECSICGQKFTRQLFFIRHMDTHKKTKPKCNISKQDLKQHQNDYEVFIHCNKQYLYDKDSKAHSKMGGKISYYFCPHCPEVTQTHESISKHIETFHSIEIHNAESTKSNIVCLGRTIEAKLRTV